MRGGDRFLTVHAEQEDVDSAWRAGAKAYVVKQRLAADLIPALPAALAGGTYVSPALAQAPAA